MEAITILLGIITSLLGLTATFLFFVLKTMEGRISSVELDVKSIKTNYINRFDKLGDLIHTVKSELLDKMEDLSDVIGALSTKVAVIERGCKKCP